MTRSGVTVSGRYDYPGAVSLIDLKCTTGEPYRAITVEYLRKMWVKDQHELTMGRTTSNLTAVKQSSRQVRDCSKIIRAEWVFSCWHPPEGAGQSGVEASLDIRT